MLLDRLLGDLDLSLEAFAVCEVAPGWRLRLGGLDWVTLHFVVSGAGRLRMSDGRSLAMPAGSLALVPSNRTHVLETGNPVEHEASATRPSQRGDELDIFEAGPREYDELVVVCGRIRARYRGEVGLFDGLREPMVLPFADSPQMAAVFERLLAEERSRSVTTGPMMSALMNEVLILLFRRLCDQPECPLPWLTALEDERYSRPLALMLEHPEWDHSLDSLSEASSMSRSSFAEGFKACYGRSPMAFLRDVRLRRASELLRRTELTTEDVATRVGYASRSQFSRAFSERYGLSPAAYRSSPTEGDRALLA